MPKPLACIYFLERAEAQEDAAEVTSISPADAVIKLVRNSFKCLSGSAQVASWS